MKTACLIIAAIAALNFCAYSQDISNQELPFDPAYRVGQLKNGLTYYVAHNEKPENRAEFWLVVHAGAMQEEADQNGLAHFCEHMAFNGTKNFPDKDILDYLQSIGMEFGPDINAWTSTNETVYTLTEVPLENKAYIDSSLMILYDWASQVSYLDKEVEKERGVIHEEWRARNSSYSRISDIEDTFIYRGSKYAKHNVIGDIDIVDNTSAQRLRDFYHDWYRPDLQAIVVVGDIDVDEIVAKIETMFGNLSVPANAPERDLQNVPDHEEFIFTSNTDKEATRVNVKMYFKQDPISPNKTEAEFREGLIRSLCFSMLRRRIDERNKDESNPMSQGSVYFTNIVPEKGSLVAYCNPKENTILQSFTLVLEELYRAEQLGFSNDELELSKQIIIRNAERSVAEKDTRDSRWWCYSTKSAYINNSVILSPQNRLNLYNKFMETISVEDVNKVLKPMITENNRVITVSAPEGIDLPSEQDFLELLKAAENKTYEAYISEPIIADLMSHVPEPGTIEKEEYVEALDAEKWTLSNGVVMYIKFADYQKDGFNFHLWSDGGYSLYDFEDRNLLSAAPSIVSNSGVGDFTALQVGRYISGKGIYNVLGVWEYHELIQGVGRIAYLEDAFKKLHLAFIAPRIDSVGYNSFMTQVGTWFKNKSNEPHQVMYDSLNCIRYNYHPMSLPLTWEGYQNLNYNDMLPVYKERIGNAADFTFFFIGNFNKDSLRLMVSRYFATLPASNEREDFRDVGKHIITEKVEKIIHLPMVMPKAKVQIEYHGPSDYCMQNSVYIRAISGILDRRFTETIREDEGGTYGVSTYGYVMKEPEQVYSYVITFECAPERVEELKIIAFQEIEKLKHGNVETKYLEDFKKSFFKKRDEDVEDNVNWLYYMKSYNENGWFTYCEAYNKLITDLELEAVCDFANKIFVDERKMDVVFLPENEE